MMMMLALAPLLLTAALDSEVTTLVGLKGSKGTVDGVGEAARFKYPRGVAIDSGRGVALVADRFNHALRQVNLTSGAVTTLAGRKGSSGTVDGVGAAARFHYPYDIAIDSGYTLGRFLILLRYD